jgi:hypothetical protein
MKSDRRSPIATNAAAWKGLINSLHQPAKNH